MSDKRHTRNGNCVAPMAFECKLCGDECCDVCHKHDDPRGECSQCPPCPECDKDEAEEDAEEAR